MRREPDAIKASPSRRQRSAQSAICFFILSSEKPPSRSASASPAYAGMVTTRSMPVTSVEPTLRALHICCQLLRESGSAASQPSIGQCMVSAPREKSSISLIPFRVFAAFMYNKNAYITESADRLYRMPVRRRGVFRRFCILTVIPLYMLKDSIPNYHQEFKYNLSYFMHIFRFLAPRDNCLPQPSCITGKNAL